MKRSAFLIALTCVAELLSVRSASAHGGRRWSSSYAPSAVICCPVAVQPVQIVWICQPSAARIVPLMPHAYTQMPLAKPVAAPPSQTGESPQSKEPPQTNQPGPSKPQSKEPPLGTSPNKGPTISESRSSSAAAAASTASAKCKVGFWNLSGRDITLKIDGQSRPLLRDRAVTLELARNFVWQVDKGEPSSEQIPMDEAFHEVIIRK